MQEDKAEQIIQKNMAFWNREEVARPLLSMRIGHDCAFELFREGAADLRDRQDIQPDDIVPEKFFADYERWIDEITQIEHDVFFTLEPFFGILWANAVAGCRIDGSTDSAWARPPGISPEAWLKQPINLDRNAWFQKLIEFNDALVDFSAGRYPVVQPLLRGPSELLNELFGEEDAIIGLTTGEKIYQQILEKCAEIFVRLLTGLQKKQPAFHGGWCLGHYRVWSPKPSCRFQEDGATLYSPDIYEKHLKGCDERIASQWEYNALHQHFAHTFLLDKVLGIPSLKCVEYDTDWETRIHELIPHLQKVQQGGKCLIVDGYLSWETVLMLTQTLQHRGLLFHIRKHTLDEAKEFTQRFHDHFQSSTNA